MANVIICDRCGSIATAKVAGGCVYRANGEYETQEEHYILCPDCSRETYEFLHQADKDVRAIMKPFVPGTDDGPTNKETSAAALEHHVKDMER